MEKPAPRDCRDEFRPAARRYRQRSRLVVCVAVAAVVCLLLTLIPQTQGRWSTLAFAVCLGAAVAGRVWALATFRCPACRKSLEVSPTAHCPECGSTELQGNSFWSLRGSRCTSCGATFTGRRGGRQYKIRYCQHCGSHVNERGL